MHKGVGSSLKLMEQRGDMHVGRGTPALRGRVWWSYANPAKFTIFTQMVFVMHANAPALGLPCVKQQVSAQ